jgi:hypothetical protein
MPGRFPLPPGTFQDLSNLTSDAGLLAMINLLATGVLGGIVDMEHILWVGKHGADTNPGTLLERPYLTFGKAMTEAVSGDVVMCVDAGVYPEEIDVPDGVSMYAPNATITTGAGGDENDAAINLGADADATVLAIVTGGDQSGVLRKNTAGTGRLQARTIDCRAGSGSCIINKGVTGGVLIVEVEQLLVGTGAGCGSTTQSVGHTHIDCQDIYLYGNGGIGLSHNAGGNVVGYVAHILEYGSPTGCTGIRVQGGRIDLMAHNITVATTWNVTGSGTLSIFYNQANGTPAGGGTILTSTPA